MRCGVGAGHRRLESKPRGAGGIQAGQEGARQAGPQCPLGSQPQAPARAPGDRGTGWVRHRVSVSRGPVPAWPRRSPARQHVQRSCCGSSHLVLGRGLRPAGRERKELGQEQPCCGRWQGARTGSPGSCCPLLPPAQWAAPRVPRSTRTAGPFSGAARLTQEAGDCCPRPPVQTGFHKARFITRRAGSPQVSLRLYSRVPTVTSSPWRPQSLPHRPLMWMPPAVAFCSSVLRAPGPTPVAPAPGRPCAHPVPSMLSSPGALAWLLPPDALRPRHPGARRQRGARGPELKRDGAGVEDQSPPHCGCRPRRDSQVGLGRAGAGRGSGGGAAPRKGPEERAEAP